MVTIQLEQLHKKYQNDNLHTFKKRCFENFLRGSMQPSVRFKRTTSAKLRRGNAKQPCSVWSQLQAYITIIGRRQILSRLWRDVGSTFGDSAQPPAINNTNSHSTSTKAKTDKALECQDGEMDSFVFTPTNFDGFFGNTLRHSLHLPVVIYSSQWETSRGKSQRVHVATHNVFLASMVAQLEIPSPLFW